MELAEHEHQLFRLDGIGEARPAAQVGEDHRDLAAVAGEDRLVAGGDDRLGELRRQESLEALHPLELLDLGIDALRERPVELLDRVVVALDAEQRPDSGEQLVVVERLRDEVVCAGLDRLRLLRPFARREHDHGQHRRLFALAQPPTDGVTVEPRHHDVEQDEVRVRRLGELEGGVTVVGDDDVVAAWSEHGLEQAHVLGDVVDDEDPCGAVCAAHRAPPQCSSTVATKLAMFTGFEM